MKTFLNPIFFLFCLFFFEHVSAQQLPLFTQYREYAGILNPAAIPTDYLWYEHNLSFGASYRRQWINDQDAPNTQVLRGDYLWLRDNVNPLFGGYIMNDRAARLGTLGGYGRVAMLFSDSPLEYGFSVGLSAGLSSYRLDLRNARVQHDDDTELYNANIQRKPAPDVGMGIFGYKIFNYNMLYGGISVPQILGYNVLYKKDDVNLSVRRVQHFYGTAGYRFSLHDEASYLDFSTWVKYVIGSKPHFDVNIRYQMSDHFFIGTGLSSSYTAHIETGVFFDEDKKMRIGFGADVPFTKTSAYYGSSLEFNIVYAIER